MILGVFKIQTGEGPLSVEAAQRDPDKLLYGDSGQNLSSTNKPEGDQCTNNSDPKPVNE